MRELFTAMMKEEWRIHTSLFGASGFVFFPLLCTFFAFAGSLIWPMFTDVLPARQLVLLVHYAYVLAGASVGAFGLFGREVMNRRFGQASLIAYSSRSLPVTEQAILFSFFAKDTVYYFFFWIFPFVAGATLAAPWIGISLSPMPLLLVSLSLSFLIGLSLVFFLSTIYVHSTRFLILVLVFSGASLLIARVVNVEISGMLPSFVFFYAPSPLPLILALIMITVPVILSIRFLKIDYAESTTRYAPALDSLSKRYRWSSSAHFLAKDILDLSRSEGGLGKIIFSFLIPVLFLWFALFILRRFIPSLDTLIVFSILLGVISSTVYNWVTEFDIYTSYSYLPVKISTVIKAKLQSYLLLNLVSVVILVGAGIGAGEFFLLIPALVTFGAVSFYAVSVTVFCTGLSPTVMLYNAKVYLPYLALIAPVLLFLIFVSLPNSWYVLSGTITIPFGVYFLYRGFNRWDGRSEQSF
ncbi:MAG: hypothetical protein LUQ17_02885 [Methanomicrobiales archaeon]|nr:hypothetical protein [Methanomicrobiales archaeon]